MGVVTEWDIEGEEYGIEAEGREVRESEEEEETIEGDEDEMEEVEREEEEQETKKIEEGEDKDVDVLGETSSRDRGETPMELFVNSDGLEESEIDTRSPALVGDSFGSSAAHCSTSFDPGIALVGAFFAASNLPIATGEVEEKQYLHPGILIRSRGGIRVRTTQSTPQTTKTSNKTLTV